MAEGPADKIGHRIKNITADLKRYIEKNIELMTLKAGEKIAGIAAQSVQRLAGATFIFGALIFLLIALALFLGRLIGSLSLGFVIVSVPFLVGGWLLINLKPRSLTRRLQSEFEKEIIDTSDTDDQDEEKKLIPSESQKILKNNEHDV
jgi:hypothetical protein